MFYPCYQGFQTLGIKIRVLGCLIAQLKRFDALITTQKNPGSLKSPILERKNAQNDHFSKMTIFWRFSWFKKKNWTLQRAGFFLCCNQCIKTLHLSYQTLPYEDLHFLGYNAFSQFFRPPVFLWHMAYKITRPGNISLILREMWQKGPPPLPY